MAVVAEVRPEGGPGRRMRGCFTAANWLRAHEYGAAAYVVLASTYRRALDIVPLAALVERAVDVPVDPGRSALELSREPQ